VGNPEETGHLEKLGVHARIILKWIKWDARMLECGLESPVVGCCEHGNEPSCPPNKKIGELLD